MSQQDPNSPDFFPGDFPFVRRDVVDELRRLQEEVRRLSGSFRFSPGGEGQYNAEDSWGSRQVNLIRGGLRGRITGQDTPGSPWYSWKQETIYTDSTTLATGNWTFTYTGGWNDSTTFNAAELNHHTAVPFGKDSIGNDTGAIVWLVPLECGLNNWWFVYEQGSESVQINSADSTTLSLLPTMNYIAGTGIKYTLSDNTTTHKTNLTITAGADSLGSTTPGSCSAFGTYAFYGNTATPSLSRLWISLGSDTAGNCKWVAFCPCDSITISGGGSVTTTCCGSTTIPITLHASITGGDCAGTYPMVYNAGTANWETTSAVGACTNSPKKAMALACNVSNQFVLSVNGSVIAGSMTFTCTPLVIGSGVAVPELVTEGCCLVAGTVTITP